MLKQKMVFNYETGRYNIPVDFTEEEKKILGKNLQAFSECRKTHDEIIRDNVSDITVIRKHNEKLVKATNALEDIGVKMNYKLYYIS